MSDREPALLGPSREERLRHPQDPAGATAVSAMYPTSAGGSPSSAGGFPSSAMAAPGMPQPAREPAAMRGARREPSAVFVVGFWRRLLAAAIDLAIVVPVVMLVSWIASRVTGVQMPSNVQIVDIDLWIDLVLATDPALVMGLALLFGIGLVYLLVFQIVVGRTLGMRVLGMRIIDVYGERPSAARCVARCAGYLAGVATLFLGFLWMGFDSEKRGLQDWIAGTYVIRA